MSFLARSARSNRYVLLLFLFGFSCERPVNPFGPAYHYVATISGLSVREKPGLEGKLIDLLPLNEAVLIIERREKPVEIGGREGRWTRIQYGEQEKRKEGWVFDLYLVDRPVERFYRVQALEGLPLRKRPDLRAEIIESLPYYSVGMIETASRRIDTIRGKRGFWFRTTYEDKQGWIFSGYVVTSNHRHELERDRLIDLSERDYEETDRSLEELLAGASSIEVIETKDFRLHAVRFQLREHEICDRPESMLVFERLRDGQLFLSPGFSARIEKKNHPMPGAYLVRSRECFCCCAEETLEAVFPDRAGPRSVAYYRENLEARCELDVLGERSVYRSENRIDPESGDFFLYWQDPACGFEEQLEEPAAPLHPIVIRSVQEFRHDLFARIRFVEGRLRIDRYQDRSVPPSLREAWERSDPL